MNLRKNVVSVLNYLSTANSFLPWGGVDGKQLLDLQDEQCSSCSMEGDKVCRRLLVVFAGVVRYCHDSVDSRHCPPLLCVGVLSLYMFVHLARSWWPGRVPNPLTLKLQITKPPCGCWELQFWHQLLLSKKIPSYQTAEQGGNISRPWYALLRSQACVLRDLAAFSVRRRERCRRLPACADSRPQCLLLSVVNCRCLSDVWGHGYVWKIWVRLVHQTSCFCPWDPPFTSENFRRRAVVIQMGVW